MIIKFFSTFADRMKQGLSETIMTRLISTTFVVVALAVFKPFELDVWEWQAYVHLLNFWMIGLFVCFVTDLILKYVVRMPWSDSKGVSYIIRRNLWFQLINTPSISLCICLYRHFAMSERVESNRFSLANFLGTLLIIAFCSFMVGLYWRFKFRSRYLTAELEETRQLNEQLKKMHEESANRLVERDAAAEGESPTGDGKETVAERKSLPSTVTLAGTTNESVTFQMADLLYVEAVGNYVKVCLLREGRLHSDMLRATSKQIEKDLCDYPMIVRCHRAFLVNLAQVEQIVSHTGSTQLVMKHTHEALPVSRSNMAQVKDAIKRM